MLISRDYRFIFVQVQKTGTSSMQSVFFKRGFAEKLYPKHTFVDHAVNQLGKDEMKKYFKFCFVRNPWDRLVSWYHHCKNVTDRASFPHSAYVAKNAGNFDEFIRKCTATVIEKEVVRKSIVTNQIDYITDPSGSVGVDFIGRFERLEADFQTVCARAGLPQIDLPHVNHEPRGPYRDYYSDETRRIVGDWYRKDIDTFGYAF